MATLANMLPWIQVVLSVLLTGLILLQQNDAGLGSAFGGGDGSTSTHTRRGTEKTIFRLTIVVAVLFVIAATATLIV